MLKKSFTLLRQSKYILVNWISIYKKLFYEIDILSVALRVTKTLFKTQTVMVTFSSPFDFIKLIPVGAWNAVHLRQDHEENDRVQIFSKQWIRNSHNEISIFLSIAAWAPCFPNKDKKVSRKILARPTCQDISFKTLSKKLANNWHIEFAFKDYKNVTFFMSSIKPIPSYFLSLVS